VEHFSNVKHCLDFSFVFSAASRNLFSASGIFCRRRCQPGFTVFQQKVLASLSLFLKSEKFPALLYVGKGPKYNPFRDFRPVRAQIANHGRAYTQALLLYETPFPKASFHIDKTNNFSRTRRIVIDKNKRIVKKIRTRRIVKNKNKKNL
jgi:hypothetical protein